MPPDLDLGEDRVAARLLQAKLTLVYGDRDEFFTPKVVAATEARLRESGIPYDRVSYGGGHELHAETLRALL